LDGLGQAMSEETAYHEGLLITGNMLDYRVPTIRNSAADRGGHRREQRSHGRRRQEAGEGSLAAFLPALTMPSPTPPACASTICRHTRPRLRRLEKRRRSSNGTSLSRQQMKRIMFATTSGRANSLP